MKRDLFKKSKYDRALSIKEDLAKEINALYVDDNSIENIANQLHMSLESTKQLLNEYRDEISPFNTWAEWYQAMEDYYRRDEYYQDEIRYS